MAFVSAFDAEKFEGIGHKMEKMTMLERERERIRDWVTLLRLSRLPLTKVGMFLVGYDSSV